MATKKEAHPDMTRRNFLQRTAVVSTAASAAAPVWYGCAPTNIGSGLLTEASVPQRTLIPTMLMNGTVSVSKPLLAESQLSFRIGLARTRMSSYPCDSMDFILLDLERPDNRSRHAYICTGDLTGRLLEFLCCAEGVDGKNDPRLDLLYERITRQQQASGAIGRYSASPDHESSESDPLQLAAASKLFHGLLRYYELTGEERALRSAEGLAKLLWSARDAWATALGTRAFGDIAQWVIEPFARLYMLTQDSRWKQFCTMIHDSLQSCENRVCHSHGFLSTLRGLQEMTLLSGDRSWNELVELNYRIIVDKQLERPDGNIPEKFPSHDRNEGCSIADWLMLNLNRGLIMRDDTAYDKAERIFWNALAFNQLITGGFGHRRMTANGYGVDKIHEAWWCCTQNAGMAMAHYARHTATFIDDTIHINFLTPGRFELPLPGGRWARIRIESKYPHRAEASIVAEHVPPDIHIKVRVPSCVIDAVVNEDRNGDLVNLSLHGRIGHRIEPCHPGVMVTYGPLIVAPGRGADYSSQKASSFSDGIPAGYTPKSLPPGIAKIKLDSPPDDDGFVRLPLCPPERPLPTWSYYDEGPGARTWVEGAAVEVKLKYDDGKIVPVRFAPMCFSTSCLSLFETPVVFQDIE